MGNPAPQPKSRTVAPRIRVRAHSRTGFTPMPLERVGALPRFARNSAATPSYPLDRSVIEHLEQIYETTVDRCTFLCNRLTVDWNPVWSIGIHLYGMPTYQEL